MSISEITEATFLRLCEITEAKFLRLCVLFKIHKYTQSKLIHKSKN